MKISQIKFLLVPLIIELRIEILSDYPSDYCGHLWSGYKMDQASCQFNMINYERKIVFSGFFLKLQTNILIKQIC